MYLTQLKLVNFRNYRWLDLELGEGLSVFFGGNASGKSSLLEAVYLLGTARSPRSASQAEMVNLYAEPDLNLPPFARIEASVKRSAGSLEIEIVLLKVEPAADGGASTKRIRINGVSRRAVDLVGKVNVVLFSPEDVELASGAPVLRRRFLDICLSQIDHRYLTTLQRYHKVVMQRNSLLRSFQQRGGGRLTGGLRDELAFWDQEFVAHGSYLLVRRLRAIEGLRSDASRFYEALSGGEKLEVRYRSTVPRPLILPEELEASLALVSNFFWEALEAARGRELVRGISLLGPHRDDLELEVSGRALGPFGSRGQQRTAALALRLAEMELIQRAAGETPIALLDDVLSELDPERRRLLTDHLLAERRQILLTTVDVEQLEPAVRARARLHRVESGTIALQPSRV
jgi:DNA replication and repair protein RecF